MVQIVAEVLGIRPQDVILSMPNTNVGVYDGGSQGSRTVRMVGGAAQVAALELSQKMIESAAMLLQLEADDLELAAVIGNAISDAIGKPFHTTPITPEDVLRALENN